MRSKLSLSMYLHVISPFVKKQPDVKRDDCTKIIGSWIGRQIFKMRLLSSGALCVVKTGPCLPTFSGSEDCVMDQGSRHGCCRFSSGW